MSWEIALGIIALFTFLMAFIKPIIKPVVTLTKAITELTVTVKELKNYVDNFFSSNEKAHERIWEHNESQDEILDNHEKRIIKIETKMEIKNGSER